MRAHQRALVMLAAAVTVIAITAGTALAGRGHASRHPHRTKAGSSHDTLPVSAMESALQAQGSMINGVLSVGIDRTDINDVTLNGVPIKPSFEVNGSLDFQPLGHGQAFFNGDLALKAGELNGVIDAITRSGLSFQAEHQHMYDFQPMVWFVHLRGRGAPVALAQKVHSVLAATSTPLPQAPPSNPTTPLDKNRLQQILHGYDAEVSDNGVVTVYVARRNPVFIDGVRVNPATNIATNIAFEPLNKDGSQVAAVPDFGMTSREINGVVSTMRARGWDIGCLYNQETGEFPQLYFSHEFKTGNPYELAQEIRDGLNQTNSQ